MTSAAVGPGALYSSPRFRQFTSFVSNIDLEALGGGPCRAIVANSDGNIVLTPQDPILGDETVTVTAGEVLLVSATMIKASGTTITGCKVLW